MKLKNVLIVVNDIERSRQFFHDLFGLELLLDNNGNMIIEPNDVSRHRRFFCFLRSSSLISESVADRAFSSIGFKRYLKAFTS